MRDTQQHSFAGSQVFFSHCEVSVLQVSHTLQELLQFHLVGHIGTVASTQFESVRAHIQAEFFHGTVIQSNSLTQQSDLLVVKFQLLISWSLQGLICA